MSANAECWGKKTTKEMKAEDAVTDDQDGPLRGRDFFPKGGTK